MSLTYHHYGASVIQAPIDNLQRDIPALLDLPAGLAGAAIPTAAHTLTYRAATCAPGIDEYVVTCTLQSVADTPAATFVEWMRAYRPNDGAGQEQIHSFTRALAARDQAVADRLAAEYDCGEVMYMDYTLGGASA